MTILHPVCILIDQLWREEEAALLNVDQFVADVDALEARVAAFLEQHKEASRS